ncbi:hypothetical protein [Fischerella thermalis]|nr:hypothetical protein [Fischerella thermalis]
MTFPQSEAPYYQDSIILWPLQSSSPYAAFADSANLPEIRTK